MMKEKLGILFDLDGTLLDTLDDLTDATNYTLKYFGCPERSRDEIRSFVGNGAVRQMTLALPGRPDDPDIGEVLAVYKAYYAEHCQIKTKPYPGAVQVLKALTDIYPTAIVSNKPDIAVKQLCAEYFPGVYALGESSGCPRKPAPDMLFQAMQAIGAEKGIYVGDSEVDILTARNANMPCLTVLWGFRDRKLLEDQGGEYFCELPEEIPEMIKRMQL